MDCTTENENCLSLCCKNNNNNNNKGSDFFRNIFYLSFASHWALLSLGSLRSVLCTEAWRNPGFIPKCPQYQPSFSADAKREKASAEPLKQWELSPQTRPYVLLLGEGHTVICLSLLYLVGSDPHYGKHGTWSPFFRHKHLA